MAKKATRSRGKYVVQVDGLEGSRTLDGGVGGVKDRRAAARLAFYWLLDNGHAPRPEATRIASKLEDGGSIRHRGLILTITEGS